MSRYCHLLKNYYSPILERGNLESVWVAICKSFIREMFYFNQFVTVFTCKSFQLLDWQGHRGCDHTHLPHPWATWIANSSDNPVLSIGKFPEGEASLDFKNGTTLWKKVCGYLWWTLHWYLQYTHYSKWGWLHNLCKMPVRIWWHVYLYATWDGSSETGSC